jgi:hypothetical protein
MLRRPFAFLVPLAGAAGLAAAPAAAQQQPGASGPPDFGWALDALLARFAETYNRKDVAGLAALFARTRSWCRPGPSWPDGATSRRPSARASSTAPRACASRSRRRGRKATSSPGVGRFMGTVPGEGGRPQERRGNFSTLFRRQGEGLLIRVHAFSFLQVPPPPSR